MLEDTAERSATRLEPAGEVTLGGSIPLSSAMSYTCDGCKTVFPNVPAGNYPINSFEYLLTIHSLAEYSCPVCCIGCQNLSLELVHLKEEDADEHDNWLANQ